MNRDIILTKTDGIVTVKKSGKGSDRQGTTEDHRGSSTGIMIAPRIYLFTIKKNISLESFMIL